MNRQELLEKREFVAETRLFNLEAMMDGIRQGWMTESCFKKGVMVLETSLILADDIDQCLQNLDDDNIK